MRRRGCIQKKVEKLRRFNKWLEDCNTIDTNIYQKFYCGKDSDKKEEDCELFINVDLCRNSHTCSEL